MKKFNIAIVGATGLVGEKICELLENRSFPYNNLTLLASKRSKGKQVNIGKRTYVIEQLTKDSFHNTDIAFFSAGSEVSKEYVHDALEAGAVVIDNTSAFRMEKDIPLIVPEVNREMLKVDKGIIANPNCSTIQMVMALEKIRKHFGIQRIIASTYQSVSGAGRKSMQTLKKQMTSNSDNTDEFSQDQQFAYNVIPKIDEFTHDGYTGEELKMIEETKKIFNDKEISISATCVRVPVLTSHSESIYVETKKKNVSLHDFVHTLKLMQGVKVFEQHDLPMPVDATNKEEVFVGRIRKDPNYHNGFHLWVVCDNLLKGAALNTVQIAECIVEDELI